MGASQGAQAELAGNSIAINTAAEPIEFVSTNLREAASIIDTSMHRGTRSRIKSQTRKGTSSIAGSIVINPSPNAFDFWLTNAMGNTTSLLETIPAFFIGYNPFAGNTANTAYQFNTCFVNRMILRGRAGEPVELELDIVGKTVAALTWPTLASPLGTGSPDQPYVFSDFVWSFSSNPEAMLSFELIIDNFLDARFTNSLTATDITPQDRLVSFNVTTPFTATEQAALFDLAQTGVSGSTLTGTHAGATNTMSVAFTFGFLQAPNLTPVVTDKTEIPLEISFISRATNANDELCVVNDSTD